MGKIFRDLGIFQGTYYWEENSYLVVSQMDFTCVQKWDQNFGWNSVYACGGTHVELVTDRKALEAL